VLTKGPVESRASEAGEGKALSLITSTRSPEQGHEWRVEWAHVTEEALNHHNNALRGRARNNFGRRKKKEKKPLSCFERERERERERG